MYGARGPVITPTLPERRGRFTVIPPTKSS